MIVKDSANYLGCDNTVSILHCFTQIDILDRKMICVHFEIAAGGWDISTRQCSPHFSGVLATRFCNCIIDRQDRVICLCRIERRIAAELSFVIGYKFLVDWIIKIG